MAISRNGDQSGTGIHYEVEVFDLETERRIEGYGDSMVAASKNGLRWEIQGDRIDNRGFFSKVSCCRWIFVGKGISTALA